MTCRLFYTKRHGTYWCNSVVFSDPCSSIGTDTNQEKLLMDLDFGQTSQAS